MRSSFSTTCLGLFSLWYSHVSPLNKYRLYYNIFCSKQNNILFFVDACQSFGKLDIDVSEMKIDLLSATAHKLYGPKGIGFLYASKNNPKVNIEIQIEGGGHENGFRSGTLPVPLIVGFAKAAEISSENKKLENNLL